MRGGQWARQPLAALPVSGRGVLVPSQWEQLGQRLRLSKRQLQVVQCLFDDWTEAQIAMALGISEHTVHTHIERLYRKLEVRSRCDLIVRVFGEFLASQAEGH